MEPFTTAALAAAITALVNGAAGEAGKSTWTSLRGYVTTRLGRNQSAALTTLESAPSDEEAAQGLAVSLQEVVRADPAAAAWLTDWYQQARAVTAQPGPQSNIVAGQAQVHGPVIQGQTFNGSINLS